MKKENFLEICIEYEKIPGEIIANNDELSALSVIIEIGKYEYKVGVQGFFSGNPSIDVMIKKYRKLKHVLRRIEYQLPDSLTGEIIDMIQCEDDGIVITPYALLIIILRCCLNRLDLLDRLVVLLENADYREYADILLENRDLVKESIVQCIYKK